VFYYNGEDNVASKHDHGEYIKVTILPRYDVMAEAFASNKTVVTIGEDFTLTSTAKNNYDQLPHDVRVGFYINGEDLTNKLFYAKVFTSAELGEQALTVPVLAPLNPGSYTITMKVDDEEALEEVEEGNNQKSFNLLVMDNSPPTVNLSGKWTMTANTTGFRTFFFQEGNHLTGYMMYDGLQKPEYIQGVINAEKVAFSRSNHQLVVPQQFVTTILNDDSLSGDFSHNNQWGNAWSATRNATMGYVEDLSGGWQGTANGYEAIVSFIVTDNILTGTIKFDVLDYTEDIKGIVDGDSFTFFRGDSHTVIPQEYQGTFDGGTSLNGFFSHDGLWNNYQFSFEKIVPPTVDLSGEWIMTANTTGFRAFFFQEGSQLTGYMMYDGLQKPEYIQGTISGDQVTFYRDIGTDIPQKYVTTYADNDSLSGDFSHNNQWGYNWSATRTATMGYVEDLSGIWEWSTASYSAILTLTTNGNILEGTIKFDVLDYTEDIKGIVDGDNFTFFRGNPQLVVPQEYQGTFDGGTTLNGFFSHDGLWNNYQFSFEKQ
jgi:hypothetical protein